MCSYLFCFRQHHHHTLMMLKHVFLLETCSLQMILVWIIIVPWVTTLQFQRLHLTMLLLPFVLVTCVWTVWIAILIICWLVEWEMFKEMTTLTPTLTYVIYVCCLLTCKYTYVAMYVYTNFAVTLWYFCKYSMWKTDRNVTYCSQLTATLSCTTCVLLHYQLIIISNTQL